MKRRWLLPEGVDEALPDEAWWIESIRRELIDLYRSWGYQLVMPPFIEYLDSLLADSPSLDLQTFKLTDQLSGKMMGVRADMTPQVARIDAHRLKQAGPARYCYLGTVLKTRPDNFAGSRSPLQVGVEFYGHAGLESDEEVISLMIETLQLCDVAPVHLDLGHVDIVKSLFDAAQFDAAQRDQVLQLLQHKAVDDLDALLQSFSAPSDILDAIRQLCELNGNGDVIVRARRLAALRDPSTEHCLSQLESLIDRLNQKYPAVEVNIDLAELSGYRYQNGVVFAAYTPGEGRELARGGRYDGIGRSFGEARPATGFSADLKQLMQRSGRQIGLHADTIIGAPATADSGLEARVRELRAQGCVVVRETADAPLADCNKRLINENGDWRLVDCHSDEK